MDVKNETEYVRNKEVLRRIRIIKSAAVIKEVEHFSIHNEKQSLVNLILTGHNESKGRKGKQ